MILQYYCSNGTHVIFDKYTINLSGIIHSKKKKKRLATELVMDTIRSVCMTMMENSGVFQLLARSHQLF